MRVCMEEWDLAKEGHQGNKFNLMVGQMIG